MNNPVEFQPLEWAASNRPRRSRFGAVIGSLIAKLLTAAIAFAILICVFGLGVYAMNLRQRLVYGDPLPKAASVPPGNYQWSPDKGLQKIN